jgi:hypothetical protein
MMKLRYRKVKKLTNNYIFSKQQRKNAIHSSLVSGSMMLAIIVCSLSLLAKTSMAGNKWSP